MFKWILTATFIAASCMALEIDKSILMEVKKNLSAPFVFEKVKAPEFIQEAAIDKPYKKAGCIILAAGAGTRLGLSVPKGCLEIGEKSLFEILLEKMEGKPVAIMTSPIVHKETKEFLLEKGYGHIPLFETKMLPRESEIYSESPQGNGVVFEAFYNSDVWEQWRDVELISVIPIDNPLADGFDEKMLSNCNELIVKAIRKKSVDEKVGTLVDKEGKLYIVEYSEIPLNYAALYDICYYGMFTCSKNFFEKAAKVSLPWHQVVRLGGTQYEKFVFDAFPLAETYDVLVVDRQKEFWPIKTQADIAIVEKILYNKD